MVNLGPPATCKNCLGAMTPPFERCPYCGTYYPKMMGLFPSTPSSELSANIPPITGSKPKSELWEFRPGLREKFAPRVPNFNEPMPIVRPHFTGLDTEIYPGLNLHRLLDVARAYQLQNVSLIRTLAPTIYPVQAGINYWSTPNDNTHKIATISKVATFERVDQKHQLEQVIRETSNRFCIEEDRLAFLGDKHIGVKGLVKQTSDFAAHEITIQTIIDGINEFVKETGEIRPNVVMTSPAFKWCATVHISPGRTPLEVIKTCANVFVSNNIQEETPTYDNNTVLILPSQTQHWHMAGSTLEVEVRPDLWKLHIRFCIKSAVIVENPRALFAIINKPLGEPEWT